MKNTSSKIGIAREWVVSAAQTVGRALMKAIDYGVLEYAAGAFFITSAVMSRDPIAGLLGVTALGMGSGYTLNQLFKRHKPKTPTP